MKRGSFLFSSALLLSLGLIACGREALPGEEEARQASSLSYGVRVNITPGQPTTAAAFVVRATFTFDALPKDELETGDADSIQFAVRRATGGQEILSEAFDLYEYISRSKSCSPTKPCSPYLYWNLWLPAGTYPLEIVRLDRLTPPAAPTTAPPPDPVVASFEVVVTDGQSSCGTFTASARRNPAKQVPGTPLAVDFQLRQSGYRGTVAQGMVTTGHNLAAAGIQSSATCEGDGSVPCPLNHSVLLNSSAFGQTYTTNVFCKGVLQGAIYFTVAADGSSVSFNASPGFPVTFP